MLAWGSSHKRNEHSELQLSNLIFNPSYDPLTLAFIVSSVYEGYVRPYLAHAFAQDSPADHLCAQRGCRDLPLQTRNLLQSLSRKTTTYQPTQCRLVLWISASRQQQENRSCQQAIYPVNKTTGLCETDSGNYNTTGTSLSVYGIESRNLSARSSPRPPSWNCSPRTGILLTTGTYLQLLL